MVGLSKIVFNQDVFFILISMSFLLVGFLKAYYWKHAQLLFKGVFAQRYSNQYLREENAFTERVNLLTFLLMSINFTLVFAKALLFSDWRSISITLIFVVLFFLIKIVIIQLMGLIFKNKGLAKLTVFFSFLFDRTLGFVLFPCVIILHFFYFEMYSIIIGISIICFSLFLILKLVWLWKIGRNTFVIPSFYIFLYLCGLEIFPLLLLGKALFY